jgi:Asp-tRNA(Asn)/Glu-tRNA(Gln) amidotransferase A subunit family amidase
VSLRAEDALADAVAIDARIARGEEVGPLAGLPLLGKDNDDVAGLRTTFGSRWFADAAPAESDGVSVGRLRAAGAIVIGKTNVPEFCIEGFTDNLLFGATHNPWGFDRSPGGSSGGSAAALAAGLAAIATATDGGGSARIPAALTGLLGFKPTLGVIGRRRAPEWIEFSTDGLMTATTDDLELLLGLVAGSIDGDPWSAPNALRPVESPRRIVLADRTDDLGPLPAEVAQQLERQAHELSEVLGIAIERREPDTFFSGYSPDEDWFAIAAAEHASMYGRQRIERDLDRLYPSTREFLTYGLSISADDYLAARRRRYEAVRRIDEILAGDAILVTPTLAVVGYDVRGQLPGEEPGLLGPEVYSTALQNIANLPAISLPAGLLSDGMPFGLQVTLPRWHDLAAIEIARRWETAHPWPRTAPGYEPFN